MTKEAQVEESEMKRRNSGRSDVVGNWSELTIRGEEVKKCTESSKVELLW